ncbi:GGDEF domain-containing protein [Paracoccus salsus]|uniref:GGDEF domain-containing protein n=1 Tax=Paracoccus salsus TaxID=2911061 RepID=UPI001F4014DE|nr:GGDEF domain-containing protein [Paracoccus salsus]MCF3974577.1 GGDEF domain-containing protein [Paracoccus salsus]
MNAPGQDLVLIRAAMDSLLPMHLWIGLDGRVRSVGPTLRKLIGEGADDVGEVFLSGRAGATEDVVIAIRIAAARGERLFLRMQRSPHLNLRGHAVFANDRSVLVNLGFGIGLHDAVRVAGLTDDDFAPAELAMELLFMREAMGGVLGELKRFNSQLEAAREAAEVQAHTDALTGLCNRRGLELALNNALRPARGSGGAGRGRDGFALAHLDLDHFKQVNDQLGHAEGDRVLCHVAQVLRDVTRSDDTAARIGGDEFVLILKGLEDPATLDRLGKRMIEGIEAALCSQQNSCSVSASVGFVLSRFYRDLPAARMLSDADAALYRSKREGRGRVTILTEPPEDVT